LVGPDDRGGRFLDWLAETDGGEGRPFLENSFDVTGRGIRLLAD
jgi:hypothetical protein